MLFAFSQALPSVRTLRLVQFRGDSARLRQPIASFRNLRHLDLSSVFVPTSDAFSIAAMSAITALDMRYMVKVKRGVHLAPLPAITAFHIGDLDVSEPDTSDILSMLPSLLTLSCALVSETSAPSWWHALQPVSPTLRHLRVDRWSRIGSGRDNRCHNGLLHLPNLRTAALPFGLIHNELPSVPASLEVLELFDNENLDSGWSVFPNILTCFSACAHTCYEQFSISSARRKFV